jgi:DNA adenine methylase
MNLKTPISYYGGKQQMLPHILPIIPEHTSYIEPFVGGGAVFWAKEPSKLEVINDLNGEVVNFYRVLQSDWASLNVLVQNTLHSRDAYKDAKLVYQNPHLFDSVTRAWAFWVNCTQSYVSKPAGGWSYAKKLKSQIAVKVDNCKKRFTKEDYTARLSRVAVESDDAIKVIQRFDNEDAFFYVDPPYINSDQGHYAGYTEEHYRALLNTLADIKGKFLLSSYPSDILEEFAAEHEWYQKRVEKPIAAVNNKRRKVEVLTFNYQL